MANPPTQIVNWPTRWLAYYRGVHSPTVMTQVSHLPFPLSLLPSPSPPFSHLFPSPPLPSLRSRTPLKPARGSGEHCELHRWDLGRFRALDTLKMLLSHGTLIGSHTLLPDKWNCLHAGLMTGGSTCSQHVANGDAAGTHSRALAAECQKCWGWGGVQKAWTGTSNDAGRWLPPNFRLRGDTPEIFENVQNAVTDYPG